MGIERFFKSIEENNITNFESNFTNTLTKRIYAKYLYIDFNSIIYITSNLVITKFNLVIYLLLKGGEDDKIYDILKDYNLDTPNSVDEFKNTIDLDRIIIKKVVEYLLNITSNYVDNDKLEHLYIAIDGVPSKSKMIEQKKRRYMGALISKIHKKIFNKYEDDLKNVKIRYEFEKNKISWDRKSISPGTDFMDKLNSKLSASDIEITLRDTCPNIKTFIFSGVYEPGEGEKKIVDHIRSIKIDGNCVIYSPDSDVTLLALILHCDGINNITLLRHNQQKDNYNVIDIDKLASNLYLYITNNIKKPLQKNNVLKDIVFALTIFGNDFLPKLESFNVRNDFNIIIDKYAQILKTENYIINSGKYNTINQKAFIEFIRVLHLDEGQTLQKTYMASHYYNYERLKKIFGEDDFIAKINAFLGTLREFHEDIKKDNREKKEKWLSKGDFLEILLKVVQFDNKEKVNDIDILFNKYVKYYEDNNKFPQSLVIFRKFSKTLKSDYNRNTLEKSLEEIDSKLKITKYDEELFKFDNMLDEYTKKLNAYPLDLGFVSIDPKTFTWKSEKIENSVKKYYKSFFGIESLDISGKMEDLLADYMEGLIWVFDFYFNNFDIKENRLKAHTWYYKYNRAPLLKQLYAFMRKKGVNKNYLLSLQQNLKKYKVNMTDFFNCLEHLMYTSPAQVNENLIPPEYKDLIKTSSLDVLAEDFWNKEKSLHIDCRGILFLTKCHLDLSISNWDQDKKFLRELRKIPLKYESIKKTGEFKETRTNVKHVIYKPQIKISEITPIKRGGSYRLYIEHRNKYLNSGNLRYKRLYKNYKHEYVSKSIEL